MESKAEGRKRMEEVLALWAIETGGRKRLVAFHPTRKLLKLGTRGAPFLITLEISLPTDAQTQREGTAESVCAFLLSPELYFLQTDSLRSRVPIYDVDAFLKTGELHPVWLRPGANVGLLQALHIKGFMCRPHKAGAEALAAMKDRLIALLHTTPPLLTSPPQFVLGNGAKGTRKKGVEELNAPAFEARRDKSLPWRDVWVARRSPWGTYDVITDHYRASRAAKEKEWKAEERGDGRVVYVGVSHQTAFFGSRKPGKSDYELLAMTCGYPENTDDVMQQHRRPSCVKGAQLDPNSDSDNDFVDGVNVPS